MHTTTRAHPDTGAPGTRGLAPLGALIALLLTAVLLLLPAPAAAQSPCGGFYTIESGDSLVEVAERCGVTVPALLAANPALRDQRQLQQGNRLRVPNPAAPQPTPVQACGPFYTVRSGDTLADIAEKCGLTVPLILAANPPLPTPLEIHGGQRVRIPNIATAAVTDPATIIVARGAGDLDTLDVADAAADTATAADSVGPAAAEPIELQRVEGVLERGPNCYHVRTAEGARTAIAGAVRESFAPGDTVVLLGIPAEEHDCEIDTVLELRILYRAG